ncbi:hypothetical protein [Candidatus Poriferisodalis sp.]|uniref:hypothetical protein n=1 Tax=Candidatus Poriferisodalis sp. TaxID=3101277 RepID=UPI003B52619D
MVHRTDGGVPNARRTLAAALLAAVLAGCGGGSPDGGIGQDLSVRAEATTSGTASTDGEAVATSADGPDVGGAKSVPEGIDGSGLENCDNVDQITSTMPGPLRTTQNYPSGFPAAVTDYGSQFDTFGGYWLDRDNGGTMMVGFTDDTEQHTAALSALPPSTEYGDVEDMTPLGQRDDLVLEVVQVTFSEGELIVAEEQISSATWDQELGIYGYGIDVKRNRVNLDVVNPPPGALAEIAATVPPEFGLGVVCVELTITAPPPTGSLQVLPDLNDPDPVVRCWGAPPMPYSELTAWQSIDEVDHPAVDVLRAELEARLVDPSPRPLAQGDWAVVHIGEDLVRFVLDGGEWEESAAVERRGDRWLWAGEGSGPRCEPAVVLPEGLGRVEVQLDPDNLPGPDGTEIMLLVTEQGCANGREMGEALRGPEVVETDDAVVVSFAVVPVAGGANCPGNPPTSVTITLSEPLGDRAIQDGLYFPPKTVTIESP